MAEIRPLPVKSTIVYLKEKYSHEQQRDMVLSDYLWIIAAANLSENGRKNLKRYSELIQKTEVVKIENKTSIEMVNDVIKKFKGG